MSRKAVKIYCSEEEYQIIESHAAKCGKTVSGYLREIALYGRAICINYDAIIEHTKIINNLGEQIRLIIKMLVQTKQAYPADVRKLVSLLEDVTANQKTMLRRTLKESRDLHKLVKNT